MSLSEHSTTCAALVRNTACDCGHHCPACGTQLSSSRGHEQFAKLDLAHIRARASRGNTTREQAVSDVRALLSVVDRLEGHAHAVIMIDTSEPEEWMAY